MADVGDAGALGLALGLERIALGAGEERAIAAGGETLVYVIDGGGSAAGRTLAAESIVWLEPGERCTVTTDEGLTVLVAAAPPSGAPPK